MVAWDASWSCFDSQQAPAQWYDHNNSQNLLIMEFGKVEMEQPGLILVFLVFQ